jgi:hypothetical protein
MFGSRARPLAAALIAVALAACDNTIGPDEAGTFDAQAAAEDYQAMNDVLDSPGWDAFSAFGATAPFADLGGAATASVSTLDAFTDYARTRDASAFTTEMASVAAEADVLAGDPLISEWHRGVTFVYSALHGRYMADPAREGAPANGVRFILYDASSGELDPDTEIGWADLIDEGDESDEDVALRLVSEQHGLAVLDYRATLDQVGPQSGVITVDGFLRNEADRLDFDITVQGTGGDEEAVDVAFAMGIESRGFEALGTLSGTGGEGGPGEIDVTVRHGDHAIEVDLESTGAELTGTFTIDGELFATASGNPEHPTFTSADGDPLTTYETGVLLQMVGIVEAVFRLFAGLVAPVAGLVVLGILL